MKSLKKFFKVFGIPKGILILSAFSIFVFVVISCAIFSTILDMTKKKFRKSVKNYPIFNRFFNYKLEKKFPNINNYGYINPEKIELKLRKNF